jgi:hypothetical protein
MAYRTSGADRIADNGGLLVARQDRRPKVYSLLSRLLEKNMPKVEGPKLVASSTIPSINISAEALGTPGARMTLHIVPQFAQNRKSDAAVLLDATRRAFIVSASLSKAPSIAGRTGHIKGDFGEKDGDSYLTIPPGVDQLCIDTPWGRYPLGAIPHQEERRR